MLFAAADVVVAVAKTAAAVDRLCRCLCCDVDVVDAVAAAAVATTAVLNIGAISIILLMFS